MQNGTLIAGKYRILHERWSPGPAPSWLCWLHSILEPQQGGEQAWPYMNLSVLYRETGQTQEAAAAEARPWRSRLVRTERGPGSGRL